MENQQVILSKWKNSASKAFWGVILTSFAGMISTIYDYVSYVVNFIVFVTTKMSSMLNGFGGSDSIPSFDLSPFFAWGLSSKGIVIIGYILYLWGLTSFASIQRTESSTKNVKKVISATILLIITFFLNIVFGVLSIIPFTGMFFGLITWVLFLVCFYKMKHAFSELMVADDFSPRAQRGAGNLRYAACCEIRLRWLPLVTDIIILLILVMFFLIGRSVNSLQQLESLAKIGMIFVFVVFLFALVIALSAMFCAFFWPIIGWYRVKTGGPAFEEYQNAPTEMITSHTQELNDKVAEVGGVQELSAELTEAEGEKRKKLYIGGGILGTILICLGLWFAFSGSSSNNPIGVKKPTWDKFVVITAEDVTLYKDASSDSPQLMEALENLESDMATREFRWEDQGKKRGYTVHPYNLSKNTVLPVLEETDTWYKVQVDNGMTYTSAYIKKEWSRQVMPEPITEDILERLSNTTWRCNYLVKKGKLNNLCITTFFNVLNGESLHVGALVDGCLIYPNYKRIYPQNNSSSNVTISKNEEYDCFILSYGENQIIKFEEGDVLDPRKLTDEEVTQIFNIVKLESSTTPMKVEYYFPEIDQERTFSFVFDHENSKTYVVDNDDRVIEGVKNYSVKEKSDDEPEQKLMAELDEESVMTGISDIYVNVIDERDDDGDGYHEALIFQSCGGSSCQDTYTIVYYNKDNKQFEQTEPFESTSEPKIEEWEGKTSYVQSQGITFRRYIFKDGSLKLIDRKVLNVGLSVKLSYEHFFSEYPDAGSMIKYFDIDDDGNTEKLYFLNMHGQIMLSKIEWNNGNEIPFSIIGNPYDLLKSTTNGMHDILVDETFLYKWNGEKYEEWKWDGKSLKKKVEE